MTEYQQQALDFLSACNATIEITLIGAETNRNWGDNLKRNKYNVTLKTPKGSMNFDFWDSAHNTEIYNMSPDEYCMKQRRMHIKHLMPYEQTKLRKELSALKANAVPTEYSILACLQKYEIGTMNDFFHEFGYEIHNADNAVVKEYQDLCRIFTAEQMEKLREIW